MTISSNQVTITDAATLIVAGPVAGGQLHIMNHGANVVYLGASDVTDSTGAKLIANWIHPVSLGPNEGIYGICSSGQTQVVSYLLTEQPQA